MNINSDEFFQFKRNGDAHFAKKDYAVAAQNYGAALNHGKGDRIFLFNFAFSLAETQNHEGAAIRYRQAIDAGSGAAAYNNLGSALRKLGRPKEAREVFAMAAKLDASTALYWRNLAVCLAELKDLEAQLVALESLAGCGGATASDWNSLGNVRAQVGENESALEAFRVAAHIEPKECAYFFNISIMQDRCGRTLDAYHSCRHSLNLNNGYEPAAKIIPRLEESLKNFAASHAIQPTRRTRPVPKGDERYAPSVSASAIVREIGPHDYVNPYTLLNLPAASELPSESEWFDRPEDWEKLLGSLPRRRRALKAELELNEGKLSWLQQLHITDEIVHRVLSKLDDSGWHAHHWALFRMPLLNRFLMLGELDYFHSTQHAPYPLVAGIAGAAPDDFAQEEFVAFISAFFRHRWAPIIKQTLDAENNAGVRALFATGAPITSTDLEEALEPLRRHFGRRREDLKQFESRIESCNPSALDALLQPALSEAQLLNVLPAHLGSKLRDDMCFAYRGISIGLANDKHDYTASERALSAAESFQASGTVKQRLTEDRTAISGLLRREREEKQRTEQLTLRIKLKSWFRERTLEITPERFTWNEESIPAEQMDGVRYGITIKYTNGIKSGTDSILALRSASGNAVATDWLGEDSFPSAVRSVMGLYAPSIMTKLLLALEGSGCRIGQLQVSKQGIAFETGIIFTKQHFVSWTDVAAVPASGHMRIFSRSQPKAETSLSCRDHWNACLLPTLIEIMKSSAK